MEHHDFPFVPGSKLPQIRHMAPEYYADLTVHHSWLGMMYQFVFDPKMGLRSRTKRRRDQCLDFYGHYSCRLHRTVAEFFMSIQTKKIED